MNEQIELGADIHAGDGGYSIGTQEEYEQFAKKRIESRIQGLINRATIRVNNPLVNSDGKIICDDWVEGVSMSKLVELVARECMGICGKDSLDYQYIREHFGIQDEEQN